MTTILHRYTCAVLYQSELPLREAVEAAVRSRANLRRAYLTGADLAGANLAWANLRGADLTGADLTGANLRGADLREAHLTVADLRGADLRGANLRGANLTDANLYGADLRDANLRGADLRDANLTDANLRGADLTGATMTDGRKWEEYSADHLAGICQTPAIRAKAIAAWGKHSWQDCPMHCALGIDSSEKSENPLLVAAWVALYDARLLAAPEVQS